MPQKVYWIQEPHIMSADYCEVVSAEDLDQALSRCLAEVEKNKVYFLVDMSEATSWPTNILKFASLNGLISHPNTQWFVFVGPSTFIKFIIQMSRRNRVKVFETRKEALAFLEERVSTEIGKGETS